MVTELLGELQRVAETVVAVPTANSVLVVPVLPVIVSILVFEMFQVTSSTTFWFAPPPLKVASAVNVIVAAEAELAGTVSGLAVTVRLVTAGQTESVAVAGVSAW